MRLNATRLGSIASSRSFGDQLYDLAGQVPTLDLNFAGTKILDPSVTFTRASIGTFVGSNGLIQTAATNEARFDHNPTTGESLGLLVEEARTNLLVSSEEFDNVSWTKYNSTVTTNSVTAPNNTTTADTIASAAATAQIGTSQNFIATAAAYTVSYYVKANGAQYVQLLWSGFVSADYANFDLSNGTVSAGTNLSASIQSVGGGWYRISITTTLAVTLLAAFLFLIDTATAGRAGTFTGNGSSGVYLWGAQAELGSFPTSYIPTTTATVTRAADVASITGSNFSSFYNQTDGTLFAEYRTPASDTCGIAGFNNNTANERIELLSSTADPKMLVVDNGTSQADLDGGTIVASTMTKTAMAYAVNDFSIVHAAGAAVTDTNGTLPTVDRLLIGANQAGNYQSGCTKRLTYWPVRLQNSTLQAIT
jgi:hypothetical protein